MFSILPSLPLSSTIMNSLILLFLSVKISRRAGYSFCPSFPCSFPSSIDCLLLRFDLYNFSYLGFLCKFVNIKIYLEIAIPHQKNYHRKNLQLFFFKTKIKILATRQNPRSQQATQQHLSTMPTCLVSLLHHHTSQKPFQNTHLTE